MSVSAQRLFNFIGYQLAWFACVLGAAWDFEWAGVAFALAVTAVHLLLFRDARELRLVLCAAAMGCIVDTTLMHTHSVEFRSTALSGVAPFWMVSLWMVFATTLNHSLRWLASRPWAAALAGAVGGPLAYLAGAKLGALSIESPLPAAITFIAFLWAIALGVLCMLNGAREVAVKERLPA
jgi:hypothetical protein